MYTHHGYTSGHTGRLPTHHGTPPGIQGGYIPTMVYSLPCTGVYSPLMYREWYPCSCTRGWYPCSCTRGLTPLMYPGVDTSHVPGWCMYSLLWSPGGVCTPCYGPRVRINHCFMLPGED